MLLWLIGAAFLGALISGIAGIGGGTLLIAVMFAVGLTPVVAIPLHALVQLVSNGSRVVAYRQDVQWRSAGWFLLAGLPLPFLTASLVAQANPDVIRLVLAAAILWSLLPFGHGLPGGGWSLRTKMLIAGGLNGAVGMVIGATGMLIGPLFIDRRWSKEATVGTLALCQSLGHAVKILAFGWYGFDLVENAAIAWPLMLAVLAGTAVGRFLMRAFSRQQFLVLFKMILLLLAIRLAGKALTSLWV